MELNPNKRNTDPIPDLSSKKKSQEKSKEKQ